MKRNQIALTLSLIALLLAALALPYPVRIARASTYADKVLSYNPVQFLKLTDAGSTAADSSGNGRTGTVYGASAQTIATLFGDSCYSFDAVNDYVNAGSDIDFGTGDLTIIIWAKANSATPGNTYVFEHDAGSGNRLRIRSSSGNGWSFLFSTTANTTAILLNTDWHMLALRRVSGVVTIYVDTQSESLGTITASISLSTLKIATNVLANSVYWNGALAYFAAYDEGLSDDAMLDLADPNPPPTATPTNTFTPTATSTATNTPTPVYGWQTPQVLTSGDWRYQAAVHMETTLGDIALVFLLLVIAGLIVRGLHVYSKRR